MSGWVAGATVVGGLVAADASRSAANKQEDAAKAATAQQQQKLDQTRQDVAPWLQAGQGALSQLVAGTQRPSSGQLGGLLGSVYTGAGQSLGNVGGAPGLGGGGQGSLLQQDYVPFTQQQFQQDPGYQFQLQQGLNTLTNKASLGGGLNSNNLKGLIGFSQGLANQDYQQALGNYIQQYSLGNQSRQQNFNNLEVLSQGGLGAGLQQGQISANVGNQIGSNIIGAGNAQAAGQVGQTNAITGGLSNAYNSYLQNQYMNQNNQNFDFGSYAGGGGDTGGGIIF